MRLLVDFFTVLTLWEVNTELTFRSHKNTFPYQALQIIGRLVGTYGEAKSICYIDVGLLINKKMLVFEQPIYPSYLKDI